MSWDYARQWGVKLGTIGFKLAKPVGGGPPPSLRAPYTRARPTAVRRSPPATAAPHYAHHPQKAQASTTVACLLDGDVWDAVVAVLRSQMDGHGADQAIRGWAGPSLLFRLWFMGGVPGHHPSHGHTNGLPSQPAAASHSRVVTALNHRRPGLPPHPKGRGPAVRLGWRGGAGVPEGQGSAAVADRCRAEIWAVRSRTLYRGLTRSRSSAVILDLAP